MNIVIMNNFWRFPGTDRWDHELVQYDNWLCHQTHNITYIVDKRGKSAITAPAGTYDLFEIEDFKDVNTLVLIMQETVAKLGHVDRIIAFSENLLSSAALLRDRFGVHGPSQEETALVRNKVEMKQRIKRAGLRVPEFYNLTSSTTVADVEQFTKRSGFPLILKPVDGASSIGVSKIGSPDLLHEVLQDKLNGQWQLEEYITGDIFHVDGLLNNSGDLLFCVANQYINTCLDFSHNSPLGAVMLPDTSEQYKAIRTFTASCLSALNLKNSAFHLELFVTKEGELVFLEVGARVAGADVPYMIERSTGVNLFKHWVDLIMYQHTTVLPEFRTHGAWLMFGLPDALPLVVRSVTGFLGTVPSVYRQLLPAVNRELIRERGYCSLQSGRFLFSNTDYKQLSNDIQFVMNNFSIKFSEVGNT